MKTAFGVGDRVVVRERVQGLKPGRTYVVTDVTTWETPFGVFVGYVLDGHLRVQNGQFVLQRAEHAPGLPSAAEECDECSIELGHSAGRHQWPDGRVLCDACVEVEES